MHDYKNLPEDYEIFDDFDYYEEEFTMTDSEGFKWWGDVSHKLAGCLEPSRDDNGTPF